MHRPRFFLNAARTLSVGFIASTVLSLVQSVPAYANPALIPGAETQILAFHNAERAARGIRPLLPDSRLQQSAAEWAYKLANEGTIYHRDVLPARSFGYRAGGENIIDRAPSLTAIFAHMEWMKSDLHRKNLLDPAFSHAGVGMSCANVRGISLVVAVVEFGADTSPSTTVPPLDPRAVNGGPGDTPAVTCLGFTAPAPPAPLIASSVPAPAPRPVVAKPKPAPRPVVAKPAPAPAPVAAPVVLPPPPPVYHPQVAVEPVPLDEPKDQKTASVSDPIPVRLEPSRPVASRSNANKTAAIWSGSLFLVSLMSWMTAGFITGRKIQSERAVPPKGMPGSIWYRPAH